MKPTDIRTPDYFHKVVDCQWACPAHTPVPEYIRMIAGGRYADAYMVNWKSNVFPGVLGRTCDRPCEPACRRGRVEDEPVAILLADDLIKSRTPCLKQMVEAYHVTGGNIVAVMDVPREQTNRYGVLKTGRDDGRLVEVTGLVEKPKPAEAPSTACVIGRYILQPRIFRELDRQETGTGNEIQLTDAMARLIGRQPFHGLRFEGRRFDCGDKAGFIEATIAFALEHPDIGEDVRQILRRLARELEPAGAAA